MKTDENPYMMILGKSKVPDYLSSRFKVSYKNKSALFSSMKKAEARTGVRMEPEQRSKLISDFKDLIQKQGNLGNVKLIRLLDDSGLIPELDGFKVSKRVLDDYIGYARVELGLQVRSPTAGINKSYKKESDHNIQKAVELYSVRMKSIVEVANEMKWSWSRTRFILILSGVVLRARVDAIRIAGHKISRGKLNSVGVK